MNWKTTAYFGLFALIFLDSFFFNIAVGPLRMTLLRTVIIGLFVFIVARVLLSMDHLQVKISESQSPFYGFGFVWDGLPLIWTQHRTDAVKELYYFIIFIFFIYVLIYLLQSKLQNSWVELSFWLYGYLIILICVVEFTFNVHLPTSRYYQLAQQFANVKVPRATAFFFNENDMAVFLVLVFPFYLIGLFNKSGFYKLMSAAGIIGSHSD